jgi:shikimate kinase
VNNLVLIGMPGAGKSTVGVLLAKTLKRPFLDTDLLVQTATDRYLQEIIATDGIDAFLDLEARVVQALQATGHVIATGGSVVYRPATMTHLRAHGTTVYLAVSCDTIDARVRNIATRGIVRRDGQSLCDLYAERHPLYLEHADVVIDADGLSPEAVVTRLAERFG